MTFNTKYNIGDTIYFCAYPGKIIAGSIIGIVYIQFNDLETREEYSVKGEGKQYFLREHKCFNTEDEANEYLLKGIL